MIGRLFLALMFAIAPLAAAEPISVLVFTTTDCPISNRYAPEIQRLAAKFRDQARFVLVYPVPSDSPEMIREHVKKFGYSIESIRDTDQQLVKQTGVTVTPEVAVMRGDACCIAGASTIAMLSSAGSGRSRRRTILKMRRRRSCGQAGRDERDARDRMHPLGPGQMIRREFEQTFGERRL